MFQAKLHMPCVGSGIVQRKKIEEKLSLLPEHRFVYISAPAGYGKTTAVVDYLIRENRKHAWFSIDESDNDPVRFWRYLTSAIARCCENSDFESISIDAKLVASNISVDLLISMLEQVQEEFIIVLDDYHLIENSTIQSSVEHLVRLLPTNIKLIFLSRKEPESYLSVLCSRGAAIRLGASEIAFNSEETAEFFSRKGLCLTDEELSIMDTFTEGWVAGLVAASFSIRKSEDRAQTIRSFSGRNNDVSTILEYEVFCRWTEKIRSFLIHTAFLDRLSGSLCSAVTGHESCTVLLKLLAESNSFIIPLDTENGCYRYHHLFQRFLLDRFERESEETRRPYYRRAGEWYLAHGQIDDGIHWLLEAGEYETAYPHISGYRFRPVAESNYSLWKKWITQIPEMFYEKDPTIYVSYSWVSSMEGELEAAKTWAGKAHDSFERIEYFLKDTEKNTLKAYVIFADLNVAIYQMDIEGIYSAYGRLQDFRLLEPVIVGELNWNEPNILKTAYGFMGKLSMVEKCLPYYDGLSDFIGGFSSYTALSAGEFYYERNQLNELETLLLHYMSKIIGLKIPSAIIPCVFVISKAKMARGDIAGAFEAVKEARTLLVESPGNVWQYYMDMLSARLYLRIHDTDGALKLMGSKKIGLFDDLSAGREMEYTTYCRVLINQNRLSDALILLSRLEEFARWSNRLSSRVEVLCLMAIAYGKTGNYSDAMRSLETALTIGAAEGYVRTFVDEGEPMAELLSKYRVMSRSFEGLTHTAYAKRLLRLTNEYAGLIAAAKKDGEPSESPFEAGLLSEREIEMLRLLAGKHSNEEIAAALIISISAVKQYNSRIYDKLGVRNRQEATAKAKALGLIP